MQIFEVLLGLLAACVALALVARHLHIPVAMVRMAGGMALALVPGLLTVTLPTSVHKRRGMSQERVWEAP